MAGGTLRADVTNPDEATFPGALEQPFIMRRGDTANLHVAGFRDGGDNAATWAAGDALTFTLRTGIDSPGQPRSRTIFAIAVTPTVGQSTTTVVVPATEWDMATEGIAVLDELDGQSREGSRAVADLQLTRADSSVFTLWESPVTVEADVT